MKNFTLGGRGAKKFQGGTNQGGRDPDYKNLKKTSYRTVVPTYTLSFSIPAQIESVYKSGELKYEEKKRRKKEEERNTS